MGELVVTHSLFQFQRNFTQLAFKGSELKAHLCHLMVWQNLQCTFINWMHHGKPKVFCSFCNINHEHLEEGSVVINSHTTNTPQICQHPLQLWYPIPTIPHHPLPHLFSFRHTFTL